MAPALIGGITGGVVSGGLYGVQSGAFGSRLQYGYDSVGSSIRNAYYRARDWIFGAPRAPATNVKLAPLTFPDDPQWNAQDSGRGPMVNIGDGMLVAKYSPIYGNRVPVSASTTRIANRLQQELLSVREELGANPELARPVLSRADFDNLQNPRVAAANMGKAMESLFWQRIQDSPELRPRAKINSDFCWGEACSSNSGGRCVCKG